MQLSDLMKDAVDNNVLDGYVRGIARNDHHSSSYLDRILERYSAALSYNRLKIRRLKAKDLELSKALVFKDCDPLGDLFSKVEGNQPRVFGGQLENCKKNIALQRSDSRYVVIKNKSLKIFEGYIEYWLDSRTQTFHSSVLAVDPSYERRGHATLLMSLAIEEALAKGYKKLTVNSTTSGIPFYVKFGCIPEKVALDE